MTVVLSCELVILVIVVLLLRGSELTTQSCITTKDGKPFASSSGTQVCRGGRWHKNGWKEEGGMRLQPFFGFRFPESTFSGQ